MRELSEHAPVGMRQASTRRRGLPALPESLQLLLRNRTSAVGLGLIAIIVGVTVLAPWLTSQSPTLPHSLPGQPPSWTDPFGTTDQGYSVFAQVIHGGRISLAVAVSATLIAMTISVTLGLFAAYCGGIVDDAINLVANIFLVIPTLPLLIVISSFMNQTGPWVMAVIIGLTSWAIETRILRGQALSIQGRDFIQAEKVTGESTFRVVFCELMPNMLSRIAAGFAFIFIQAVFFEAALEFLGFGDANKVSWGTSLFWATNNSALLQGEWWHFLFPGLAISITILAIVFVNYGIDEIGDPRLRQKGPKRPGLVTRLLWRPRRAS
jgi:peptide/nickel transport system permease protein